MNNSIINWRERVKLSISNAYHMPGRFLHCLLLLQSLLHFFLSEAQDMPQFVEKLTTAEGLSSNKITAIVQDDQGFLWIATSDGLNRFDGTEVVQYFHEDSSHTLAHNYVYCLKKLSGNYIAAGTEAGLSFYDSKTGMFENFYYKQNTPLDEFNNAIIELQLDKNNNLWAASRNCLFIFDNNRKLKQTIFSPFTEKDAATTRLRFIKKMLPLPDGSMLLWLHNGIYLSSAETGTLVNLEDSPHKKNLIFIADLVNPQHAASSHYFFPEAQVFPVYDNYFLCIKQGEDSLVLRDKNGQQLNSCFFPFNKYPYVSWSHNVLVIDSSRLAFLFHNYGLTFIPVSWQGNRPIIQSPVMTLFETNEYGSAIADRQGNCWLGTTEEGLQKISPYKQFFQKTTLINAASGKETKYEMVSASRYHDRLWIAMYGDGFFEMNLTSGKQKHYRLPERETNANFIWNIRQVSADTLWLGTQAGLFWFCISSGKNGRLQFPGKPPILDSVAITTQFPDSRGLVWMGLGKGMGVGCFNPATRSFTYYPGNSAKGYPLRYPTSITEDSKGNLWFVSDASHTLIHWDRTSGHFQTIMPRSNMRLSNLCGILCENDSILWIGSITSGLVRYHIPTGEATIYGHERGLANSHVTSIYKDRLDRLWVTTDGSISCFNPKTATFSNYSLHDGLPVKYPTSFFYYDEKDERLYNGGHGAVFWFDPEKMNVNTTPPPTLITAFSVNGKPYRYYQDQPARLKAFQNDITIHYTAVDMINGRQTKYAYKLIGEDGDWVMAGHQRQINFSRLAPGHYTFMVRAANSDGVWSEQVATTSFYIRPKFTQTPWFYVLIVLITGAICYLLYRFRLAQIRKTEAVRSEISKNLHDEVGASLTNISLSSLLAQKQLQNEAAVSKLLDRIYQDSQNVSEAMREIVWSINPHIDTLGEALPRMLRYASELLEAKGIELQADIDPAIESIKFPMQQRRDLYLIFKETINNLAKHSRATKAFIRFRLEEGRIIMRVSDNGVGFDTGLPQLNNGLKNMKERSKSHRWDFHIESGQGKGTSLTLEAPVA